METTKRKGGRPKKPPRFRIIVQRIEDGKTKHFFTVISNNSITEIMKTVQTLDHKNAHRDRSDYT